MPGKVGVYGWFNFSLETGKHLITEPPYPLKAVPPCHPIKSLYRAFYNPGPTYTTAWSTPQAGVNGEPVAEMSLTGQRGQGAAPCSYMAVHGS